jgi:hypothetical protein
MKRLVVKQHRVFTLVEIMVTMAILVVMMSFLFQFVLGAQRIWSGTTKNMEMFEDAQVIFDVMEADLKNMIFEIPEDNPDGGILFYLDKESGSDDKKDRLKDMCFMASYSSGVEKKDGANAAIQRTGVYPIYYQLVPTSGSNAPFILYRYNFDRVVKKGATDYTPFFAYGSEISNEASDDFADNLDDFRKAVFNGKENIDELREILSENIETLKVEVFPYSHTEKLLKKKPISFRITLKLRQKNSQTPEIRTFSKIVFVD